MPPTTASNYLFMCWCLCVLWCLLYEIHYEGPSRRRCPRLSSLHKDEETRCANVHVCIRVSLSGSLPRIITQCPSAALPLQNRRYLQATRPRCIPLIILRANAEIPRQMLNMLCSCAQNLISRSHVFARCIIYTV